MGILIRLVVSAIALWITTIVVPGVTLSSDANDTVTDSTIKKILTLLAVAAIFGLVNAVLRPIIKTIGCMAYVVTLGLIALVVNGALFMLTSFIADQLGLAFHVDDFWPDAIVGALLVGIVSWVLNLFVPSGKERKERAERERRAEWERRQRYEREQRGWR